MRQLAVLLALAACLAFNVMESNSAEGPSEPSSAQKQTIDLKRLVFTVSGNPRRTIPPEKLVYSDRGLELSLPIYRVRKPDVDACETVLTLPKEAESLTVTYRVHLSPHMVHRVYSTLSNGLIYPLYVDVRADEESANNESTVAADKWTVITLHISTHAYSVEINGKRISTGKTKGSLIAKPLHLTFGGGGAGTGARFVLESPTFTNIRVSK